MEKDFNAVLLSMHDQELEKAVEWMRVQHESESLRSGLKVIVETICQDSNISDLDADLFFLIKKLAWLGLAEVARVYTEREKAGEL